MQILAHRAIVNKEETHIHICAIFSYVQRSKVFSSIKVNLKKFRECTSRTCDNYMHHTFQNSLIIQHFQMFDRYE